MKCSVCGKEITPDDAYICADCGRDYCAVCAGACGICDCRGDLKQYS